MATTLGNFNVTEQAGEVAGKAWEGIKDEGADIAKSVTQQVSWSSFLGLNPPNEEAEKQQELQEKMYKLEGYKQARRKLDLLLGKTTDEKQLDEDVRLQVEKEEKRLSSSFRNFEMTNKSSAEDLGQQKSQPQEQQKTQEDEPMKTSHESGSAESLELSEPNLPGSKGKKAGRSRMMPKLSNIKKKMQTQILQRSQAKAEIGRNQGQG